MKSNLPKAVIYARVSGSKQVREGDGLRSQESRCREFASYKGYEVLDVFRDDISGGSTARPGMTEMIKLLRKHRAQGCVVIIDDISRFARDVVGHWELREMVAAAGGKLESPSIEFGEDSDSILVENLLASVSQHQRQKNAEQTVNRMRARAMNGYWLTKAPIGYRIERVPGHGKMLVRDEPLASIIADAMEGFASGRLQTLSEVKRFLESQPAYPRNRNNEVHIERVAEMFDRCVYAGHITHEDWGLRLIPGKHEPLISLATWQTIQDRRYGVAKVPARKDVSDEFPLRGFVCCAECSQPLTACWSKGRSARYPYYLCDTRGCSQSRKSIRREKIEGEFESLLASLRPTEGLFNLAFEMFRDLWDARMIAAHSQGATLEKDIKLVEKKIADLLDRVVEASSSSVVRAYEKRIDELEMQKAIMRDKIANCGKPLKGFNETYRTAFDFLANPCKLWNSPRIEDRRAVLKLVFAEQLPYARGEGYRTAQISMPFKMLGGTNMAENGMVRAVGIEPTFLLGAAF